MLSRTADSLVWLARYVERADNTARILDAASRLAAPCRSPMPAVERVGVGASLAPARSTPFTAALRRGDRATTSSISSPSRRTTRRASRAASRPRGSNARAVRTALTTEMWEAINGAWLELKRFDGRDMDRADARRVPAAG